MTVEDDRVQQLIELEKENTELREMVGRLTRERDTAQAQADSRALAALQVLSGGTDLTRLQLLVETEMHHGGSIEVKPMELMSEQVQGIFEALKKRFKENRDWGTLRKAEQGEKDALGRLRAEGDNRDLWQGKAESATTKLKFLTGMIEGFLAMDGGGTLEDYRGLLGQLGKAVEVSDSDAAIEIRCACWYRARLTEMKRQLHLAVEAANPVTVVPFDDDGSQEDKYKSELVRQRSVAASFAPELRRLSDAVSSMDQGNYATLVGVIPGGSTDHVAQLIARDEGVDETANDSLPSSTQPSSE